jgi:antitoxin Phd
LPAAGQDSLHPNSTFPCKSLLWPCHPDRSGPGFPTSRCWQRPRVRLSVERAAWSSSTPRVSTGNPGERSGGICSPPGKLRTLHLPDLFILTSLLTSLNMAMGKVTMTKWQLQDAKARFSELIEDTLAKGPQIVTRRGIDTAVVVSLEEWRKLKDEKRSTWKEVLLGVGPEFELPLPKRGTLKSRRPPVLD